MFVRRALTSLVVSLVAVAALAGPAVAATQSPGDDGPPPTAPDPDTDRLLETPVHVKETTGHVAEGLGTSSTRIWGAHITGPGGLDLAAIDTTSLATSEENWRGVRRNHAWADFAVARASSDLLGRTVTVPEQPYSSESWRDQAARSYPELEVALPEQQLGLVNLDREGMKDGAHLVMNLLSGRGVPVSEDAADAIIDQTHDTTNVSVAPGALLKGLVNPGSLQADAGTNPEATADSGIQILKMLSGLTQLVDAGIGDHRALVSGDEAVTVGRELKIKQATVLEMGALLDVLGIGGVPINILAEVRDKLGVDVSGYEERVASFGGKAETFAAAVKAFYEAVTSEPVTGMTCEALKSAVLSSNSSLVPAMSVGLGGAGMSFTNTNTNAGTPLTTTQANTAWPPTMAALGLPALNCIDPVEFLQQLREATAALVADLDEALWSSIRSAPLLSLIDVNLSLAARARVDREGKPSASVAMGGGAAKVTVGEYEADIDVSGHGAEWNATDAGLNAEIRNILGSFGSEYGDLVHVQVMPQLTQETAIREVEEQQYAAASGELQLLKVFVDLPSLETVVEERPTRFVESYLGVDETMDGVVGDALDTVNGALDTVDGATGGGLVPGGLGRADAADDPIVIDVAHMVVDAQHARPGVTIQCNRICDSSKRIVNDPWDPEDPSFEWGDSASPVPGSPGGGMVAGNLPRTGGLGTWPIGLAAVLAGASTILRRMTRRATTVTTTGTTTWKGVRP
jgi:hypothetical protein